jgi:hypothetical protein
MRGRGPALDKIKKGLSKVNNWLKKTKAISRSASALSSMGLPYADKVASVAGLAGYGRRRRGRRRRRRM